MTFYGPVAFDKTGKNKMKPMVVIPIQDGVQNLISQAAIYNIVYPFPGWSQ